MGIRHYTVTYNVHLLLEVTKHLHFRPKVTAYCTWVSDSAQRRWVYNMILYDIEFEGRLWKCNNYFNNLRISRPWKVTERYQDQFGSMNTTRDDRSDKMQSFDFFQMTLPRHEDVLRRRAK